ncbi:MAG TPA: glycosyltransferase [Polyangiaceae bacterium]|jgi:glycosyltransferase involved in cell wall biosynthesis
MTPETDVVCLSQHRWDFVYQRPNHLMSRFARERRTFFFEAPVFDAREPQLEVRTARENLFVATPHVPRADAPELARLQRAVLDRLLASYGVRDPLLWFCTPTALAFAPHVRAKLTVYDCMDDLPAEHHAHETDLFARADLVFTGGHSLWEAKRARHPRVYPFPSSVDAAHFAQARTLREDPADQASIPRPRLGYFGVVDERMDLELVARIADARPDWHVVMIDPTANVDPAKLPRRQNVHWLGQRAYDDLPSYIAGWDVALIPFAMTPSTRFISPTKTLEYLAAGKAVVSTPVRDVVRPYGERGLVRVADHEGFVEQIEQALEETGSARRAAADAFVARTSWDVTFRRMAALLRQATREKGDRACSIT